MTFVKVVLSPFEDGMFWNDYGHKTINLRSISHVCLLPSHLCRHFTNELHWETAFLKNNFFDIRQNIYLICHRDWEITLYSELTIDPKQVLFSYSSGTSFTAIWKLCKLQYCSISLGMKNEKSVLQKYVTSFQWIKH